MYIKIVDKMQCFRCTYSFRNYLYLSFLVEEESENIHFQEIIIKSFIYLF